MFASSGGFYLCRLDSPQQLLLCSALPQVTDNFDRQDFNRMCWTLCFRKNLQQSQLFISNDDAFKIWCIFNFLSEDSYPLNIVTEEVSVNHSITPENQSTDQQLFVFFSQNII